MADSRAKEDIQRFELLRSERGNFETLWEEVATYIIPYRGGFSTEITAGTKLNQRILDSTGPWATETLASAIYGFVINPASAWFNLGTLDPNIVKTNREAAAWLQYATAYMYALFAAPNKRFYDSGHEMFLDEVPFGTGIMMVEDRPNYGTCFKAKSLAECYLDENYNGDIDTCFRKFKMTTRQIVQQFGMPSIPNFENILDKEPMRKWDILHSVYPRTERQAGKLNAANMPYASKYTIMDNCYLLKEAGYWEFPILAPRWTKRSNEVYGRGPGIVAISDIRMINEMKRTTLKGAQKVVDPPLQGPDDSFVAPIDLTPGALNWYTAGFSERGLEPIMTNGRPELGRELMQDEKEAILRAFYVDKLRDTKSPSVEQTRTEWLGNQQERLIQMAPQLGRTHSEFTGPLVQTVLTKEIRARRLPPPPDILKNIPLLVQYVSPLARAQKMAQLDQVTGAMSILQPFMQVKPEIADYISEQGVVGWVFNVFDTPVECTNPIEEVQRIQQQRQEQMEQNQQLMALQAGSQAVGNLSKAQGENKYAT